MKHQVLDLPMQENDANAATVRDYMKALLKSVLIETESFSGKRPFGNSDWYLDMHVPLVKAGIVSGKIDEDNFIYDHDSDAADAVLLAAIDDL
jgi:hypothetical protein